METARLEFQGKYKREAVVDIANKHNHCVIDRIYAGETKRFAKDLKICSSVFKKDPIKYLKGSFDL